MGTANRMFQILGIGILVALSSGSTLPKWENLNCEEGHKYLFSDVTHTWHDARDECELYGGWLVSINDRHEQNCLLEYAQSAVHHGYFWHDANDANVEGKFVHAYDNSELTWINHLWRCNDGTNLYSTGLDYLLLGMYGKDSRITGSWCDEPATNAYYFICEGSI